MPSLIRFILTVLRELNGLIYSASLRVSSDVHRGFGAGAIVNLLNEGAIADLLIQYPDVDIRLAGEEQRK